MVQAPPDNPTRADLLHVLLLGIVDNAYLQAPTNVNMQYPCIRYQQDGAETQHADNRPWRHTRRWELILITSNPDPPEYDALVNLSMCAFERHYVADDLHHFVFNLFF